MCMTLCVAMTGCSLPFGRSASVEEKKPEAVSAETSVSETVSTEVSETKPEEPEEPEVPEEPEGPNGAPDDDYTCYIELLSQYFYSLSGPLDTYMDYEDDGYYWLADFRYDVEYANKSPLALVGFSAHDYSGDGKLDLIIAEYPIDAEWDKNTSIKAIYTRNADEEYVLTLEGWGRNRQYMLDDGLFYNEGSSGATENCFGTYRLSRDGSEVVWKDFYFSTYNGVTGEVEFYHNSTGIWDISAAEKMDIKSETEFWDLQKTYQDRIVDIDLIPLYKLQGAVGNMAGALLVPMDASIYPYDAAALKSYDVCTDDNPVDVVLEAYDDVYDVTLCEIEWGEDRGGEQDFTLTPSVEIGDIGYGEAVLVRASFPGDMSALYYKFKDSFGTEHCYYAYMSGYDGSIALGELY